MSKDSWESKVLRLLLLASSLLPCKMNDISGNFWGELHTTMHSGECDHLTDDDKVTPEYEKVHVFQTSKKTFHKHVVGTAVHTWKNKSYVIPIQNS